MQNLDLINKREGQGRAQKCKRWRENEMIETDSCDKAEYIAFQIELQESKARSSVCASFI